MTLQTIGPYVVKSQLRSAGKTAVFHAVDPDGRDVAVKLIGRPFVDDDWLAGLRQEVALIDDLDHPAIVPIETLGDLNGHPYLVTGWMGGGSLSGRLRREPLDVAKAVVILARLAGALDALHDRGIVHNDLTASNVLFDEADRAHLGGFGSLEWGDLITLSPEQARGEPADRRSNVYSLGAIVFQMLTGWPPYQADDRASLVVAHETEPVVTVQNLRPDLPPDCDAIVKCALAQNPADRYETAGQLADALAATAIAATGAVDEAPQPEPEPKASFESFFGGELPDEDPSALLILDEPDEEVLEDVSLTLEEETTAVIEPSPPIPPPSSLPPARPPRRRRSPLLPWLILLAIFLVLAVGVVLLVWYITQQQAAPLTPL